MLSPESKLHLPNQGNIGKLPAPQMPGLTGGSQFNPNPFSGIRRAGQAKRAMNFEKWQGKSGPQNQGQSDASFSGAKHQSLGALAGTQVGSMKQNKFS